MKPGKPIVLVPACNRVVGQYPFHVVGKKYVDAVRVAGCQALIVPNAQPDEVDELLGLAHGVLLTGSPSNVHPSRYDEAIADPTLPLDPDRDAWTLALIPRALKRGMPLFAICRGTQETNVALGGSLHQQVHAVGTYSDHRPPKDSPPEVQYGLSHAVTVEPGGLLEQLLGLRTFDVNSVHGQAVNRLAPGLRVEARAPDGLVEAFTVEGAPGFNLCVQWHPEWRAEANPVSMTLLEAFGRACAAYRTAQGRPRKQQPWSAETA
jgi:putative glutamine amidotransferase